MDVLSWQPFSWPSRLFQSMQPRIDAYLREMIVPAISTGVIPKHIGIIMDGNRRYGKKEHIKTIEAHTLGFTALKRTLEWCLDLGVKEVSVYAFSIENFQRPKEEVDNLMQLAKIKFIELLDKSDLVQQYGISIRIVGDLSLLPRDVQAVLCKCMWDTRHNTRAVLNVCFSYTAQDEITQAVKAIAVGVEEGKLNASDVCEDLIEQALYTGESVELDVLVRTSGEVRLSDFLLWQSSYSLLVFMRTLWPEFSIRDLASAVLDYQRQYRHMMVRRKQQKEKRLAERREHWLKIAHKLQMESKE
eukprot:Ihof_evm8s110 gene=Ihof_evmTU8s110